MNVKSFGCLEYGGFHVLTLSCCNYLWMIQNQRLFHTKIVLVITWAI